MASLLKKYSNQKLLGKIYTPHFVVEKMLQDIGYVGKDILGKTVLEPSCGDGRFLVVIAERVIQYSPADKLKENLEKIYGWDIDKDAIEACLQNLNNLIQGLPVQVSWNIEHCNSLEKILSSTERFDFIVGNPPYIRIQHLSENERRFIQGIYNFCKKGSTDIYMAFYELCNALLAEAGKCALITPNTFLYTETGRMMRAYFERHQTIFQITNFGDIQLFENATTYSAIMMFGKEKQTQFKYEQTQNAQTFEARWIDFQEIQNQKIWQLSLVQKSETQAIKLKDICKIHVGLTTLADKVFLFKTTGKETNETIELESKIVGKISLERGILRPIIKASKIKNSHEAIKEYILFPYEKKGKKHQIIPEARLQTEFPLAYQYLLSQREALDNRDAGKPNTVAWYAFGRSQGLDTSFGKKILFSPMNIRPNFVLSENEEATFYSGYCIKYEGDYDFLLQQLNSDRLAHFIAVSARDFRGGWKAYNKKTLEEFGIELPADE